jgi:hypothetical protein
MNPPLPAQCGAAFGGLARWPLLPLAVIAHLLVVAKVMVKCSTIPTIGSLVTSELIE